MSSERDDETVKVEKLTEADGQGSGVMHGDAIIRLVDASLKRDRSELVEARQAVVELMGMDGLVDVAGVIATFTLQNRAADATGLPLDAPIELATRRLRTKIGVDAYNAATYTHTNGWLSALLAPIAEPLAKVVFKLVGRRGSHPRD